MSLLDDIQTAATDPSHPLSDLLRKCQILAFRLRHEPFKAWVAHELNGYPNDEELPLYRGAIRGEIKADLSGVRGLFGKNVGVPLSNIPEDVRERAVEFKFYEGVAMLEGIITDARRTGDPRVMSPFPTELAAMTPVWLGYETISMWREVPVATVAGILDQVRTRALAFTLEIEAANPAAGEAAAGGEPPVPVTRIDYIFNTTISGGDVAIGPGATVNVTAGDLPSLLRYLEGLGVGPTDRDALVEAITADAGETERPGSRVRDWLGRMAFRVAAGGERVGEGAAGGAIAIAIVKFFNLA